MKYLQPRRVCEIGLRTLRVVEGTVTNGTPRGPNGQASAIEKIAAAVAKLGRLVDYLFESDEGHVRQTASHFRSNEERNALLA